MNTTNVFLASLCWLNVPLALALQLMPAIGNRPSIWRWRPPFILPAFYFWVVVVSVQCLQQLKVFWLRLSLSTHTHTHILVHILLLSMCVLLALSSRLFYTPTRCVFNNPGLRAPNIFIIFFIHCSIFPPAFKTNANNFLVYIYVGMYYLSSNSPCMSVRILLSFFFIGYLHTYYCTPLYVQFGKRERTRKSTCCHSEMLAIRLVFLQIR